MGRRETLAVVLLVGGLLLFLGAAATCKVQAVPLLTVNYPGSAELTIPGSLLLLSMFSGCTLFLAGFLMLFAATTAALGPQREEPDEEQGPDSSDR